MGLTPTTKLSLTKISTVFWLATLLNGSKKGYIYSQLPPGWILLITESGIQELEQGGDQHLEGPIVDVASLPNAPFRRIFEKAFAKPCAVVERTI